ncbi:MAG: SUMF1/EgtB/PvdO family nonheme iron enzyme [Thermoguttaceae bacterium]|nr:SUMF1/EgtB/PvdO family nonheme iron enzyme [Thermoguttaceae bacterium]
MKQIAFLVGINRYQNIGQVNYAEQDAEDFSFALRDYCGFSEDDIFLLRTGTDVNTLPTRSLVERRLRQIRDMKTNLDLLIVGFWGHGFTGPDGKRYLCAVDTLESELAKTAVSLESLQNDLVQTGASNTLLILDCCQNYPGRGIATAWTEHDTEELNRVHSRDIRASREKKQFEIRHEPRFGVMNACSSGQRAYEWDARHHGIFTAHLLDALEKGIHTYTGISTYLSEQITQTTMRLNKEQTPTFRFEGSGDIELSLQGYTGPPQPGRQQEDVPFPHPKMGTKWHLYDTTTNKEETKTFDQIVCHIDAGEIPRSTQVWCSGMADWQTITEVREFRDYFAPEIKPRIPAAPVLPEKFMNETGQHFQLIPFGEFMMGDTLEPEEVDKKYPGGNVGWYKDAHPRHKVVMSTPFYMGIHEVTVGDFRGFVNATGYKTTAEKEGTARGYDSKTRKWGDRKGLNWQSPGIEQESDHPVTCVSWYDAEAFIKWLNAHYLHGIPSGYRYRLPSEAQWEYACRAGSQTDFFWGNRQEDGKGYINAADQAGMPWGAKWAYAFPFDSGNTGTAPVGSFKPNVFGLYDMLGNVSEWCNDWYGDYPSVSVTDPTGPEGGSSRVDRGGSWSYSARDCRSAARGWIGPGSRSVNLGFRLALVPSK